MKRWMALALLICATTAYAQTTPAKKELVAKLLELQQPGLENLARAIAERPAMQLMQAAGSALHLQVPPERRALVGKSIETEVKKFVEETVPLLHERAIKLAPSTMGVVLEEKFSEDELKQLIAWFEAPVNKKYQQFGLEMQRDLTQKVIAEAGPALDPKLQAVQQRIRDMVASSSSTTPPPAAKPAAQAASK